MTVVLCGIVPHPPVMVPEVGGRRAADTAASQDALLELGRRITASGTETLVLITPHGSVFGEGVGITMVSRLRGDLSRFGAPKVAFDLPNDLELAAEIRIKCEAYDLLTVAVDEQAERIYRGRASTGLDHGVTAPLYWLRRAGAELPLVVAGMGLMSREKLYLFGRAVREAAAALQRKTALIASGDLSHRLTRDAPAGYSRAAKDFDARVVELLRRGDLRGLVEIDEDLAEEAGECGLRPIIMMLGALDGRDFVSEVLSYEAPFGVGYMVAALVPGEPRPAGREELAEELRERRAQALAARRTRESYLASLARRQVESHCRKTEPPDPGDVPPEFQRSGGTFVSIKKHGQLRGCIGTILPTRDTIVEEVLQNALAAANRDPRFFPVRAAELEDLQYSVDVLSPLEPVEDLSTLDPKQYGVVVSHGRRSGVLLPDLEGIDTVADQLAIVREKAGLAPDAPIKVERFTVTRYT
ncbi:MAG: AmmeMemoRadiSam system protein A [Bacillota bacterium]|jgi:AmmeMemoRadiSam system protein A